MLKSIISISVALLLGMTTFVKAETYFVSPSGSDSADGLSEATSWATIDNGDRNGILAAGDTINIMSGTYTISAKITLLTSGSSDAPVIYQNYNDEPVSLDAGGAGIVMIESNGKHVIIKGLELKNTREQGIHIKGDSSTVRNCYVHHTGKEGYRNEGKYVLFLRNIAAFCSEEGFKNEGGGDFAVYYHDVAYSCGRMGFELKSDDSRVVNCISALNDKGINGNDKNICAFNDVWGNINADYGGGVADSAGGISENPRFVDPVLGDFRLQAVSPAIDAGTYLGYPYLGAAPEIGAFEFTPPNQPPVLSPIGDEVVDEGQNLSFDVSASDPDGGPPSLSAENMPVNAGFADHGDGTGTFEFNPDFSQAGIYSVLFIASDGELADSEYVEITVNLDPISYLVISPDSAVVSADSTFQFKVAGFSSTGEERDSGTITWKITEEIGSIDSSGLFAAQKAGIARIIAVSSLGPVDTNAYLEVIPGQLTVLEVLPKTAIVSADSSVQFTVYGFDANGNPATDFGILTWVVLNGIGNIDGTGLFDATTVGHGFVRVESDLGPVGISDTIFVEHGAPAFVNVLPEQNLAVQGLSYQYSLAVYDADSNHINDTTSFAGWSTTDPTGLITADGLYTAGSDPSPPPYYVIADLGAFSDSGNVTVITDGLLDHVRIEWSDGTPLGDTTFTTDDDSLKLFCRGYDSGNNDLGNIAVSWILQSDDSIGILVGNSTYHTTLNLSKPGTGRIIAKYSDVIIDTSGIITCLPGAAAELSIFPDIATVSADSSIAFRADAFDEDGNLTNPVKIDTWNVLGNIGSIGNGGIFDAVTAGTGYVTCRAGLMKDTSGAVTVVPGSLRFLEIIPDSVEVFLGETCTFEAAGVDVDGNETKTGNLSWEVINNIGTIDAAGIFTATAQGKGKIAVVSDIGGIADTNMTVIVLPTNLKTIVITPDTASLRVNESLRFFATGFDSNYNPMNTGTLSWEVIGGIGTIDPEGDFTAAAKGVGKIAVTSSINAVTDTTNLIVVEVPTISEIPLGNQYLRPNQSLCPVLAFRVSNAYEEYKYLESVRIRNSSRGDGDSSQLLSNIKSVSVYSDYDGNGILDSSDAIAGSTSVIANEITIALDPVTISLGSSMTFFVSLQASLYPHDGDSLDFYFLTAKDLIFFDGTILAGADTINSLGYCIIDGMVSEQIKVVETGSRPVSPEDGVERVLTLDIPRNGYRSDTMNILSMINVGTAGPSDVDSFLLFKDDGDNLWEGYASEIYYGKMPFTGKYWSISGVNVPLTMQTNRFYICADIASFAADGATILLGIPKKGIEVASENDGPLDNPADPIDTITIVSTQGLSVQAVTIPGDEIIPGEHSAPLAGFTLVNGTSQPVQIDSFRVSLFAEDPAGALQSELNSQVDSVFLWLNRDQDFTVWSSADSIIGQGILDNDYVIFETDGLTLAAAGGSAGFFVTTVLDVKLSKNGNTINFGLSNAFDIYIDRPLTITGSFPVKNPQDFVIDAFPAAAISINPVPGKNLIGGQTNQIMLDFSLPGNGYSDAVLQSLAVVNQGTTNSNLALSNVRLWEDLDSNGLSGNDLLLGQLNYSNEIWQIINLRHLFSRTNNRFLVTADIANGDFQGGTLRFAIPVRGIKYQSGTDGPDDVAIGNPESHFLLPSNRVTAISIPQTDVTINPGENFCPVLTFALYNGYRDTEHLLKALRLTNHTRTASDDAFADYELGQISLYYDKNGNRTFDDDSLLAVGYFTGGILTLNGVNTKLSSEELAYFFVMADLPLNVIDNDTLAVAIESASDFMFSQTVNLNGDLPLLRGGIVLIDGSVKSQYILHPTPSRTLSPGDSNVCLFAFNPAVNGNLDDLLEEIIIEIQGDADSTEIASLSLWLDGNGDDQFQETDLFQGNFVYSDGEWIYSGPSIEAEEGSAALFVTGNISLDARTGRTIQVMLPINGCQYTSGNDGPIDAPVIAEQIYVISASGLRISLEQLNPKYTVSQDICVRATATNLTPDSVEDVMCDISMYGDQGIVNLDSSYLGPVSIAPGESVDFFRCYTAVSSGELFWQIQAYSETQPESTVLLVSDTILIQSIPSNLKINLISSIPASVIRGQTHVFPMSLSYSHPESDDYAAPIRLDSLRVGVCDGNGNPRSAGETFSRMVLSSAYTNLAVLEDLPSESSVLLVFDAPDVLFPGDRRILSLMVDIDSAATVGDFMLKIERPEDILFVEYNTGQPIELDSSVQFPLQTASCRIDNPSQAMAVSYVPTLGEFVNYGQDDVGFINLILRHPGQPQSSQIQLTGLSVELIDSEGETLAPGELLEEIKLLRQGMVIGYLDDFVDGQDSVWLQLNAPPVLSPGEIDTLNIACSMLENTSSIDIGMRIEDSTAFTFRDVSSGLQLSAISDKDSLSAEEVFPMLSGIAQFKRPAENLNLCISPLLPSSVVGGADSVALFEISMTYPVTDQYSPIRVNTLDISVLDSLGNTFDPLPVFDRIGYILPGGSPQYQSLVTLHEGRAEFDFRQDDLVLSPGDGIEMRLIADIENDAPYDHFKLAIQDWSYFGAFDATDTTHDPGYLIRIPCESSFPYESGVAKIFLPAGRPVFSLNKLPSHVGFPGQEAVILVSAEIRYQSASYIGDLELHDMHGEILQRTQSGLESVQAANLFDKISLFIDDELIAGDSLLGDGLLYLEIDPEFLISRDNVYKMKLVGSVSPLANFGNYVLRFADSTFLKLTDKNLGTEIYAGLENETYPLMSADLSLSEASLEGSFTNYPNPFNPDQDGFTRIAFVLDQDAVVDIEIFTLTGKLIKALAQNSHRQAGAYMSDTWSGDNDLGLTVIPGTYFCRITARYESGKTESFRRKIAVIR